MNTFKDIASFQVGMSSCCQEYNCIHCCKDTHMPLSYDDIDRISRLGYEQKFFVRRVRGWLQLKNRSGKCVFHDGAGCIIYDNRPEGCQLYPVIFDKELDSAVVDDECLHQASFHPTDDLVKKLNLLVSKIEQERKERMKETR
jgi:uncharacterized protein